MGNSSVSSSGFSLSVTISDELEEEERRGPLLRLLLPSLIVRGSNDGAELSSPRWDGRDEEALSACEGVPEVSSDVG